MITKVLKGAPVGGGTRQYGRDVGGLLRYLYGPGKSNEHETPHLVASWDGAPSEYEPAHYDRPDGSTRLSVGKLSGYLTDPVAWSSSIRVTDPHVYHVTLSTGPDDRQLSDEEWAVVAADMMDRVGIAPVGDPLGCRWVAVRHGLSKEGNDHIHIAATLARQDGALPNIRGDYLALREGARQWEERLGLTVTAAAGQAAAQEQPNVGERPKQRRLVGGDLDADGLAAAKIVRAAASRAHDSDQFFALLEANGMNVHRVFDRPTGDVRGYAVSKDGNRWTGSELEGQSFPRLQRMWSSKDTRTDADRWAYLAPPAAENTRLVLARSVRLAAAGAHDEGAFFTRLRSAGFAVRVRYSSTDESIVTGYAVGFKGHTDAAGKPVMYSGSKLGGQSIQNLREQWSALPKTGPKADAMGADTAARKLNVGAKLIDSTTGAEREGTAYAAGVAMHNFAVGSEDLRGGPMTELADQLGRAADPAGKPTFGGGSLGLMQAARGLYVLKGAAQDKTHKQVIDILASAFLLAEALHRLRASQGRGVQAQAATQARDLAASMITDLGGTPPTTAHPGQRQPTVQPAAQPGFANTVGGVDHGGQYGPQSKRKGPSR